MSRTVRRTSQGAWEEAHSGCPHGYHVLKAVPVLQLVPQKPGDGALLARGQRPHLQTLVPQGHAKEDPEICVQQEHISNLHRSTPPSGQSCAQRSSLFWPLVLAGEAGGGRGTEPRGGLRTASNALPAVWAPGERGQASASRPAWPLLASSAPHKPPPGVGLSSPPHSCLGPLPAP